MAHLSCDIVSISANERRCGNLPGRNPRERVGGMVCACGWGGIRLNPLSVHAFHGLSPRVRGNPSHRLPPASRRRSIPAGAGEPPTSQSCSQIHRVYPRGCGGTVSGDAYDLFKVGLSPRVRGNPGVRLPRQDEGRSIPAGAREPFQRVHLRRRRRVYPRGCGGTARIAFVGRQIAGSIPAGAGEPRRPPRSTTDGRVYPPRVRGNRDELADKWHRRGSIPAGAGEPQPRPPCSRSMPVYPRGCGGTI